MGNLDKIVASKRQACFEKIGRPARNKRPLATNALTKVVPKNRIPGLSIPIAAVRKRTPSGSSRIVRGSFSPGRGTNGADGRRPYAGRGGFRRRLFVDLRLYFPRGGGT